MEVLPIGIVDESRKPGISDDLSSTREQLGRSISIVLRSKLVILLEDGLLTGRRLEATRLPTPKGSEA